MTFRDVLHSVLRHMTSLVGHVRYLSLIFNVLQDYLFKMVVMPILASHTCAQPVPQDMQNN